jgi:hypothetical protein
MGLILERKGDLERAAAFYDRAGNKKRADEIRQYRPSMTGTFPIPNLAAMMPAERAAAAQQPSMPMPTPMPVQAQPAPRPVQAVPTPMPAAPTPMPSQPPRNSEFTLIGRAPTGPASLAPVHLDVSDPRVAKPRAAFPEQRLAEIQAAFQPSDEPVRREDGAIVFPVSDVAYVRSDLVTAITGQLEHEAVNRRYRGRRTDSLFGGPDAPLVGLLGKGQVLLDPDALKTALLGLRNEEVYLLESAIMAFGAGLSWENGRLPSEGDRDLDIVHLRGTGRVVLGTQRPVVGLEVRADQPVTVHAGRLIGWTGQLVPYRGPLPGLPEPARRPPIVRFEGSGLVLAV